MARISWVGSIENRRIELKNKGCKPSKVADILSSEFNTYITRDMINGRERIVKQNDERNRSQGISLNIPKGIPSITPKNLYECQLNNLVVTTIPASVNIQTADIKPINIKSPQSSKPVQMVSTPQISNNLFSDEMYDLKDTYIASEETKKELKRIWNLFNNNKPKKILSLSDLHAPYMDFKKIEKAIRDNLDCNICVLNGDIFDGESMSVFEKMEEIDVSKEFEQVFEVLDVLSARFEYVIWVGGNHDYQRFCRYIMKNIKPGLRKFAFDRLNPMKYISEKYPNVITINHNMLQIGDIVFKHPNGYSGVEMKTVVNELDIITANRFDLPNPNFRSVIIGHTHDMGSYIKNGVMLMETGCLCYTPDYRFNNPVKRKWSMGYAVLELDNQNKIIFNKSKWVYLED